MAARNETLTREELLARIAKLEEALVEERAGRLFFGAIRPSETVPAAVFGLARAELIDEGLLPPA